jgi:hypothetical protein
MPTGALGAMISVERRTSPIGIGNNPEGIGSVMIYRISYRYEVITPSFYSISEITPFVNLING